MTESEWLSTVFQIMPLGAVIHAADGRIIAVNPAACSILGLNADQLMGLTAHDPRWQSIDEDGKPLTGDQHPVMITLRTGKPVCKMLVGINDPRRSAKRWILTSSTPEFRAGEDRPHRVCVLFEDITDRREAEEAKFEAEDRFRALFEHGPIAVAHHRMIYDNAGLAIDYLFLDANDNYLRLTGVDPRGKRVTEAFPGIQADPFDWIGRFDQVVRTGETMRFQQHLQVNDRWYDCVGYRTSPGHFVAAFLEITEQKHTEAALRASEENLRITLESIGDAVIATDAQGIIVRMNRVAENLTGWGQAEAVGRKLLEVFRIISAATRIPCENPVERVLASGQVVGLANHTALIARDGTERQIADSGAPIRNSAGGIVGVVLVFRDVTGEYELQEQLSQSRKLDALGQLAGGVAHDFNNMLAGIMSAAELLKTRSHDATRRDRLLEIIVSSSDRAADLTRKLLTFARKGRVSSTSVPVHESIAGAIALLEHSIDKRVVIRQKLTALRDKVEGDLSDLQNVFLNLGINAAHAMPQGGELTFTSREVQIQTGDTIVTAFSLTSGPYLEIVVRDTGSGIAPQHLPRIFDPFFTTKPQGQGTGLGLTAAYGTVRQHRGSISVASELGRGTAFTILLPIDLGAAPVKAARPEAPQPGRGCILLVEDEEVIRATTKILLTDLGYEVVTAVDGAAGLAAFAAEPGRFALVILDMIMPVMDGRTCFERLRALDEQVRVVICSGFSQEHDIAAMRQQGECSLLRKPYRETELAATVADILRRPRK